ncbi:MAG: hypothetical protein ACOYNL_00840 [Rickettsiales bacterium]
MTSINPSLFGLNMASAEAVRIAAAERGAEEIVAAQLRQAAEQSKFTVGATITARYQYKVGPDGSLVPQQTQVTTTAPEDETTRNQPRRSRDSLRESLEDRRPRFTDLAKPKPELSPTEELALFAAEQEGTEHHPITPLPAQLAQLAGQTPPVQVLTVITAEASDENGDAVEAELLTPEGEPIRVQNEPVISSFTARAQFAVAGLYARNNDVVYNVTPLAQLAA